MSDQHDVDDKWVVRMASSGVLCLMDDQGRLVCRDEVEADGPEGMFVELVYPRSIEREKRSAVVPIVVAGRCPEAATVNGTPWIKVARDFAKQQRLPAHLIDAFLLREKGSQS